MLAAESLDAPVIGRLVDRGLDDELKGSAYAVVDGVDGRTHHIKLPDLEAAGDSAAGSIVELRAFDDAPGQRRRRNRRPLRSRYRSAGHGNRRDLARSAEHRARTCRPVRRPASAPRYGRRWIDARIIWSDRASASDTASVSPSIAG